MNTATDRRRWLEERLADLDTAIRSAVTERRYDYAAKAAAEAERVRRQLAEIAR
jgi:hypothetical protein